MDFMDDMEIYGRRVIPGIGDLLTGLRHAAKWDDPPSSLGWRFHGESIRGDSMAILWGYFGNMIRRFDGSILNYW